MSFFKKIESLANENEDCAIADLTSSMKAVVAELSKTDSLLEDIINKKRTDLARGHVSPSELQAYAECENHDASIVEEIKKMHDDLEALHSRAIKLVEKLQK